MLTVPEISTIYAYTLGLPDSRGKDLLIKMQNEYCAYSISGTPEECAQRKELMSMSYEDIMRNFNGEVRNLQKEVRK